MKRNPEQDVLHPDRRGAFPFASSLLLSLGLLIPILASCHAGSRSTPTDPIFPYLFTSSPAILTGDTPLDAVLLDTNDDGILDLATADSIDGTVSLFLGVGDGTFSPPTTLAVGPEPSALFAIDLNRDRFPDLLVALFSGSSCAVLLNDGTGTYLGPLIVEVGPNPSDVEAADFDRDGFADLVTTNQGNGTISVALGTGSGTFGAANHFSVVGSPTALSIGDLDLDGLLDLGIVSPAAGVISILHGDGNGFFPREQTLRDLTNPTAILMEEVDGDQATDLVITDGMDNTVTIFSNDLNGSATPVSTFEVGTAPCAIARAQLAGDDLSDLVVANRDDNTISILNANVDGAFVGYDPPTTTPVGQGPVQFATGDLESDQDMDVLVVCRASSTLSVLQSRFDEDASRTGPIETGEGASGVSVGDFNGDGNADIVTANSAAGTLSVHRNRGDGSLEIVAELPVGNQPRAVDSFDFDNDGFDDIAFVLGGDDELVVVRGDADFQFDRRLVYETGREPRDLVVADFNRDLVPDAAVLNGRNPSTVFLYLGDGSGELVQVEEGTFSVGLGPQVLAAGDFNRDLRLDLFVANTGENSITVHFGVGDGTFEAGPRVLTDDGSAPRGLTTGDFNGDSFQDLVVTLSMTGMVSILFGDGEGDFLRDEEDPNIVLGLTLELFGQPRAVGTSDLNSDGFLDLAVCLFGRSTVAVLLGDGADLTVGEAIEVGSGPSDIDFSDLDRNGRRDLTTANSLDGTLSIAFHRDRE